MFIQIQGVFGTVGWTDKKGKVYMNRRDFLKNCAIAALGYTASNHLTATAGTLFANKSSNVEIPTVVPNKPNIILCMADDLSRGDLGYYGNTVLKTPSLDKLGSGQFPCIRFDRWYTGAP